MTTPSPSYEHFYPFVWFQNTLINVDCVVAAEIVKTPDTFEWALQVTLDSSAANKKFLWKSHCVGAKSQDERYHATVYLCQEFRAAMEKCYQSNSAQSAKHNKPI